MRIDQAHVAPNISFFKKNFLDRYNLKEYYDTKKPVIFFGGLQNSNLIKNHQGIKIILPSTPNDYPLIDDFKNTFIICSEEYKLPENVVRKNITPEIKNYNLFTPNILGDKIYHYSGFENGWNLKKGILQEIQKNINYEIITTNHKKLNDYFDINYLKSEFYDKCFLNLNLTGGHGLSTVIELGLMGRKTVFKPQYHNSIQRITFPNFIYYSTIEDIIKIIEQESQKIGTIQNSINAHNVGDQWLNLDYWL